MRIKLDENIPVSLVTALDALGHDADSVPQEGLTGKPDPDVWRGAQECGRFLITQDLVSGVNYLGRSATIILAG